MMLELKNIYKTYNQGKLDVPVLKDISLTVDEGEYVAIMGPSGSGKTTLMNIIGCLDSPSSGEYFLEGKDIAQSSDSKLSDVRLHSIGFVFQSFYLLSRQSALDNVALPLLYAGVRRKERQEIARKALERVGLGDRVNFKPTQLSGGQCQRVAIARAIVNNPKVLLADEPTGALDTKSGEQIMEIFQKLNEEGVTIVMITHEPEIAAHAKRTLHIRDGRLLEAQPTPSTEGPSLPADMIPPEDFHITGKSSAQKTPSAQQPQETPEQSQKPLAQPQEPPKPEQPAVPAKEPPKPADPPKAETAKASRQTTKGPRHAAGRNAPAYQARSSKRSSASGPRHGAWAAPAPAQAAPVAEPAPMDKTAGTVLFEEVNALLEGASQNAPQNAPQPEQIQQTAAVETRPSQPQRSLRRERPAPHPAQPARPQPPAKAQGPSGSGQRVMRPGGFGSPIPTDLGAFFPRPSRERNNAKEKPLIPRTEY